MEWGGGPEGRIFSGEARADGVSGLSEGGVSDRKWDGGERLYGAGTALESQRMGGHLRPAACRKGRAKRMEPGLEADGPGRLNPPTILGHTPCSRGY
jgi:hypothetical protein